MTRECNRSAVPLEVYTAPVTSAYGAGGNYSWTARPDLVALVERVSGSTPSTCRLTSRRDPDSSAMIYPAVPGEPAYKERLPSGAEGTILQPYGLPVHTFIKVEATGWDEAIPELVFLGRVWGYRYNRQGCRMEALCRDFREDMRRIRCKASRWRRPITGDTVFVLDLGPHFNAAGLPDQQTSSGGARGVDFITPLYNRDASGQADVAKEYASFWRAGDAMNCLRDLFSDDVHSDLDSTEDFLIWPEAEETGIWSYLFTDPVMGDPIRLADLDLAGRSLSWAIDAIVSAAGAVDWTLTYVTDGGVEKAQIEVYELFGASSAGEGADIDLALGEPGTKVQDADENLVHEADLEWDWSESYAQVRAVGGRNLYDITLSTEDSNLAELGASHTAAWRALASGTDAEKRAKNSLYPDAYLAWGAADGITWSDFFSGEAWREGPRRALAELASWALAEDQAADRPVRLRMIVWRKIDGSWEKLPGQLAAVPLRNRVGFRLPSSARISQSYGGETAAAWSWDTGTNTAYPMRVTICVEADRRLAAVATDAGLAWPAGELYLPAGSRYRYAARSKCFLPATAGVPVMNGGTDTEFGAGAPDTVRDDTDDLTGLAYRRLAQVRGPRVRGALVLPGIRARIFPGWLVGRLTGGGDVYAGGMTDVDLGMAVRSMILDAERQTTTLRFEGA